MARCYAYLHSGSLRMERNSRAPTAQDEDCGTLCEPQDGRALSESDVVESARRLMLATLDTGTSVEALAASVHMSKRHFLRLFKRATGTTPHNWRVEERVRGSLSDLRNRDLSLTEIAHRYGFADHAHFSRVFKRVIGTPPGVWRAKVTCNDYSWEGGQSGDRLDPSVSSSSKAEQESTNPEGRTGRRAT
ncbi:hypothetical protein PCAR4_390098 [Paraburkholderia caribensis]|nr:hypothetical protein PCAR4_390098 [Paraburkholderia caribensis]